MSLKKYHGKRDFKKTPEPFGKSKTKKGQLYIIQKHAASRLHYDFRLELNGVLLSWAIPKGPCLDPSVKRLAVHVEDHPVEYGSFEGIIPAGEYGGGTVMLWDRGTWEPLTDIEKAYKKGDVKFQLHGEKLQGAWKLIRIQADPKNWLLIKVADDYAKPLKKYDIVLKEDLSVVTQQTIPEIAENYKKVWGQKKLPVKKSKLIRKSKAEKAVKIATKIKPQLATLVDKPPVGDGWIHEVKFDGYRLLAFCKDKKITLRTRRHNDWTEKFPNIAASLKKIKVDTAIFDGEVVVLNEKGHSDFQALQNSLKQGNGQDFIYYIFDLLHLNGRDLRKVPLLERKEILKNLLAKNIPGLRFSGHVIGSGDKIFKQSCKLMLEGIVCKNSQSYYTERRGSEWLKVKCLKRQEFIIGGYTKPQGARHGFGSLLIGVMNKTKKKLDYCGHVGTGFTHASLMSLEKLLKKNFTTVMPFVKRPPKIKDVTWVQPKLIGEVAFTEWTKDNILRHPSFKGLRSDKTPGNVIQEVEQSIEKVQRKVSTSVKASGKIAGKNVGTIQLSHPEKILYPKDKVTKQDVADYYQAIHPWMLPYVAKRPLTLVRCPQGHGDKCFYQKHTTDNSPKALHPFPIRDSKDIQNYIYIDEVQGLLELAQLAVLEIHPWGSTIKHVERPDVIIFDLDPAEGLAWKNVVQGALEIRDHLSALNLTSFVKTTGGKGLHVVVPIKPQKDWDYIKNFCHVFVDYMVVQSPKKYVSNMSKIKRKGKIFLDYLRNQRGATAVAPYSLRAREGATVSTPLEWDELTHKFQDTNYNIHTVIERLRQLKRDPWREFFKLKQSIDIKSLGE